MKKHWLALLILALLCVTVFSASAYAATPDRMQLSERTYIYGSNTTTVKLPKPYETWFFDGGYIYAVTFDAEGQAITGVRFSYTSETKDGKEILTLGGGSFENEKLTIDGNKAVIVTVKNNQTVRYGFDVFGTPALLAAQVTSTQNGSYIDYTFDVKNANGSSVFHYDIFNSDGELVQSGHTTEKSLHYKPAADDTYRLFLTAMDEDLDISEYDDTITPYADHPELVIENGVVTGYKGTGTSVTVPKTFTGDTITGIGANAFSNGRYLEKIELPDTLTEIAPSAFTGCSAKVFCGYPSDTAHKLSDVRHPFYDNSDAAGEFALMYMSISDNDVLALYRYTGAEEDVKVPAYVDYIYNDAFKDNRTIKTLDIPGSVIGIGSNAFYGCSKLNEVTVGTGMQSIGVNAFYNCVSLQKLELTYSTGITEIGSNAFYNCPADIYCDPNTGTTWKTVSALPRNFFYDDHDGKTTLELRNDEGLVLIGCYGTGTEITIPRKVVSIADNAFAGKKALTKVTITADSELVEIGDSAFSGCSNLKTVDCEAPDLLRIGDYAFNNCAKLENLDLTQSKELETIGAGAFYDCKMVKNLKLPKELVQIGNNAFYNCPAKIVCERSTNTAKVLSAMPWPFYESVGSAFGLRWENGDKDLVLAAYSGSSDTVTVPGDIDIVAIDPTAFDKAKGSLKNVTILASVKEISTGTFDDYDKLEELTIAGGTQLEADAVRNCQSLEKVTGLTDLSVIETNFDNCPKLLLDMPFDSVRLALGVAYAEKAKILQNASGLQTQSSVGKVAACQAGVVTAYSVGSTKIYLYKDDKIGICKVEVLSGLSGLKLPAALEYIEEEAFVGSDARFVALPGSVKEIGSRAFADNAGLKLINIPKSAALDSKIFDGSKDVRAVIDSTDTAAQAYCEANGIAFQYAA